MKLLRQIAAALLLLPSIALAAINPTPRQCAADDVGITTSITVNSADGWSLTPLSGSKLVAWFTIQTANPAATSYVVPTGFTIPTGMDHYPSGTFNQGGYVAWDESDGTETEFITSWTNNSQRAHLIVCEFENTDLASGGPVDYAEDTSNSNSADQTAYSGEATPTASTSLAIALYGIDVDNLWSNDSYSDSFTEVFDAPVGSDSPRNGMRVATKVLSGTSPASSTNTTTDTGIETYNTILIFDGAASDVTAPTITVALAEGTTGETSTTATLTATDASGNYTAHFGVYANGSTPTAAQVEAGSGTGYVSGTHSSDAKASGAQASWSSGANLTGLVAYDVIAMVTDASGNDSATTKIDITTLDQTAPAVTVAAAEGTTNDTSTTVTATYTDALAATYTLYGSAYANGAATPSHTNVKNGTGTGFVTATADSDAQNSGVQATYASGANLSAGTPYDIWVFAEDPSGNQSALVKVDITTTGSGTPPATIAFDAHSTAEGTGTSSTAAHTFGSDALRVALACVNDEGTASTISVTAACTGQAFIPLGQIATEGSNSTEVFYLLDADIPTGACNITAARTSTGAHVLHVLSYENVVQSAPFQADVRRMPTDDAADPIVSGTLTTQNDGAWLVGCASAGNADLWDAVGGQTERGDEQVGSMTSLAADKVVATAGATTFTADSSNNSQSRETLVTVVLEPFVSAPTVTDTDILLLDTFTGSGNIADHTPDVDATGNGWAKVDYSTGFTPGTATIVGNKAVIQPQTLVWSDVGTTEHGIRCRWDVPAAGTGTHQIAPAVRGIDTDNRWSVSFVTNGSTINYIQPFKSVAGTATYLPATLHTFAPSTTVIAEVWAHGNTIHAAIDGVPIGTAAIADATHNTGTRVGIGVGGSATAETLPDCTVMRQVPVLHADNSSLSDETDGLFHGLNIVAQAPYQLNADNLPSGGVNALSLKAGGSYEIDADAGVSTFGVRRYDAATNTLQIHTHTHTRSGVGTVAPVVGTIPDQACQLNASFSFNVAQYLTTTGEPAPTWTDTGTDDATDAGLTLATLSGVYSGQCSVPGVFSLTSRATNATGNDEDTWTLTVTGDSVPDPFSFVDQVDVALATPITSAAAVLSGFNVSLASCSASGGTCAIDGGAYGATCGPAVAGSELTARVTSNAANSADATVTVTCGGVSDGFTVRTQAAAPVLDITPDPFSFLDKTNASLGVAQQACVTISGLDNAVSVAVTASGGTCTVSGGAASTSCGNAANGSQVCALHTSSGTAQTAVDTVVTVGNVSDTFSSITGEGKPICTAIPNYYQTAGDTVSLDVNDYCTGATFYLFGTLPGGMNSNQGGLASGTLNGLGDPHLITNIQACNAVGCTNVAALWHVVLPGDATANECREPVRAAFDSGFRAGVRAGAVNCR